MKKVIILSLLTFSLAAQNQKKTKNFGNAASTQYKTAATNTLYTFSTFTAAYQPITGTSLTGGTKWDDPEYKVPIGFNFKLYGNQNDSVYFSESFASLHDPNYLETIAAAMFEDICDRAFDPVNDDEGDPGGMSDVSYTVTGTVGSRICKIQVSNAGFYGEIAANGNSVSYLNLQLWFYEGSNDIEFRYGNVNIQNANDNLNNPVGFLCGLAEKIDLSSANAQSSNVLSGLHNNPSMVSLSTSLSEVVTGNIANGRVYKFSRATDTATLNPTPGIDNNELVQAPGFYPNPANNTLYINKAFMLQENTSIEFYDLAGKLILSEKLQNERDLSQFKAGIYFVKIRSAKGETLYNNKLVISEK